MHFMAYFYSLFNQYMKKFFSFLLLAVCVFSVKAQTPKTYTSSEILLQLKKLNVLGSVLYIAAHPDDENTRLLAYLANEKLYRTGYLSLTRGDGGQNLIGDEQGIDLGLIRTQELLAARRIDGAEQFFSTAYDFGFSKSADEALAIWGHDKILSDVVWVIRKFKPDVIITRFPGDSRAGHGHHAASAILAREAFDAAADPAKFPEQLQQGVTVWQAKRILWNTFNFGGNNTQNESQFKLDVGMYNPLLGKSYGEIAALSRSQHKSQGFGVPAQRGSALEYFETTGGEKPVSDLMDGIDVSWKRIHQQAIEDSLRSIIAAYDLQYPAASLKSLVKLYNTINTLDGSYWKQQKLKDLQQVIENSSALFLEATTNTQYAVQGDSLSITVTANNREGAGIGKTSAAFWGNTIFFDSLKDNVNGSKMFAVAVKQDEKLTQPYWLENPMNKGSFAVTNQQLIGKADNDPLSVQFNVSIEGTDFTFIKPLRYKFTDPVKGEIYQPVYIYPQVTLNVGPAISLYNQPAVPKHHVLFENYTVHLDGKKLSSSVNHYDELSKLSSGGKYLFTKPYDVSADQKNGLFELGGYENYFNAKEINYDHIPSVKYFIHPSAKIVVTDLKTAGRSIGYITGAGDKVPQALEQMGYKVTLLKETNITPANLKQFDAVITGVRAYNTNEWMNNVYDVLMQYVHDGGVLLVQYNTSSNIGPVKAKIAPYPFNISRNRITDENAKVNFLLPNHPALNYPNKITEKDFEVWIQERSIYHAEKIDEHYQRIFSMKDPGENEDDGSLIIANYGKGKFIYTGLVFFRELPAGVPGAYRLFANLIAPLPKAK